MKTSVLLAVATTLLAQNVLANTQPARCEKIVIESRDFYDMVTPRAIIEVVSQHSPNLREVVFGAGKLAVILLKERPDLFNETIIKAKQALAMSPEQHFSEAEEVGLVMAHMVGKDEVGRDGSPARVGNYTDKQLEVKMKILQTVGFNSNERRILVEKDVLN